MTTPKVFINASGRLEVDRESLHASPGYARQIAALQTLEAMMSTPPSGSAEGRESGEDHPLVTRYEDEVLDELHKLGGHSNDDPAYKAAMRFHLLMQNTLSPDDTTVHDAARYRWLRQQHVSCDQFDTATTRHRLSLGWLDGQIDLAIAAAEGEGRMRELPITPALSDRMRLAEDMRLNYRTMEVCDLSEWCHQAMEQLRLDEKEIEELRTPATSPTAADYEHAIAECTELFFGSKFDAMTFIKDRAQTIARQRGGDSA